MREYYIGTNQWKVRSFNTVLGIRKFLLYGFVDTATGWRNIVEKDLSIDIAAEEEKRFAMLEIARIETL